MATTTVAKPLSSVYFCDNLPILPVLATRRTETRKREKWQNCSEAVVAAFRHAWKGYETYAWGYDELHPITRTKSTWMDVGMTIVDSLDTAFIMDQKDIFDKAALWVEKDLKFSHNADSNVFELTIRILGGLLSAYHLSGEKNPALLRRATEMADILLLAFNTPTRLPLESINFATRKPVAANGGAGPGSVAEMGTLTLEFKYLSYLTKDPKYWEAVQQVERVLAEMPKKDGLAPIYLSTDQKRWMTSEIRLGSRGDSYYEYLGKTYLLTGESFFLEEYRTAVGGIRKHLLAASSPNSFFYVGELPHGVEPNSTAVIHNKMDHLVCFLPGLLALLATQGQSVVTMADRLAMDPLLLLDLELAEELGESCWQMYRQTPTGLSPEIVYWNRPDSDDEAVSRNVPIANVPAHAASIRPAVSADVNEQDFQIRPLDAHNLLRPETIESLFVLWRVTGNKKYREWGWEMFQSFETYTKVENGYTSLANVKEIPPPTRDKMETFFLGETLKYFYLLFSDLPETNERYVSLTKYVLNTEAHPLPKFDGQGIGTAITRNVES
ncbi:glycoside hydrolase [Phlyctochytrium arcticum]|nr:glycoside hydrolase [Phlyctochytrium arcticum]